AKAIAPNDPEVAAELGKLFLSQGKPGEALVEFGRALALAPRNPEAFNNRGVALGAMGQVDAARRDFERALELNPCLFDARFNLLNQGVRTAEPAGCRYTPDQQAMLAARR